MVKRFISTLVLVVALVGSVSAQSLDDLSKKVFDLSFETVNKGMNAYEEQLEKQELEEAKKDLEEAKKDLEEAKKALEEAKKIEEETKKIEEATKKLEEEVEEADTENNKLLKFQWFQEVEVDEDSDEEIELCNALAYTVFNNLLSDEDNAFRVYCAGVADYVWFWYRFAKEDDGNHHVDLYTDDNGNVGHELCSGILKDWRYIKVKNTLTGTVSTAILIYIDDDNFKMLLIQDNNNPNNFVIFF